MKKLIEVSLPLEAINVASAREKSIRHGHPSTLHLWWARRPLAACRAVLFSSLVDDPSEYMPDEESARIERERLFDIIEDLVIWENSNNEEVLDKARMEIARSVARNLNVDVPIGKEAVREFLATKAPPVLDPFAGGGSIPLEAQRLGLRAYASDLNPVAVLINKAMIEIPPKFANMPPIHPVEEVPAKKRKGKKSEATMPLWQKEWKGAQGLAEDVLYYGKWMRDEAFKRIGHLYPPVTITKEMLAERADLQKQGLKPGDQLTVIASLWTCTVKCPNPACGAQIPLARSFILSSRKDKEAWVEPRIEKKNNYSRMHFIVKTGKGKPIESANTRNGALCLACNTPAPIAYIRTEAQSGRMESQLMALVIEGPKSRFYLPPSNDQEEIAKSSLPEWKPDQELQGKCRVSVPLYGMSTFGDLFTNRQLVAMSTLVDLIPSVYQLILKRAKDMSIANPDDYASSVALYLAFAVNRLASTLCTIARWTPTREQTVTAFARQAIQMTWDFPDVNPFAFAAGDLAISIESVTNALMVLPARLMSTVMQEDATDT